MENKPSVSIFILSHNRPQYASKALLSAVNQTYKNKKIIFSDNSSDYKTKEYLDNFEVLDSASYEYRYRNNISPSDHFNRILDEVDTEYVVLFHDDDLLKSDYLEHVVDVFFRNKSVVCVGCNADIIDENGEGGNKYNPSFIAKDKIILSEEMFYDHYCSYSLMRAPPFPSYIYKAKFLNKIAEEYKYADLRFVANILKFGSIYWSKKSKMQYRVHQSNDSTDESVIDRKLLLRDINANMNISGKKKISYSKNIRFLFWVNYFISSKKSFFNTRYVPLFKFVLIETFTNAPKIFLYFAFKIILRGKKKGVSKFMY
jgi:glycosyltransferase involved in cell wall biosynthesis